MTKNMNNQPIINLINYLRKLANQHKAITSFIIGEEYELNEFSNVNFPLLFLELPIVSSFVDLNDLTRIQLTFTLKVLTNIVQDKNGNDRQVTESMITKMANQISYTDLSLQDQLMNNAYAILVQICSKIALDASNEEVSLNGVYMPIIVQDILISNAERVTNKDAYQSSATFTVIVENSYLCPLDSYFDYNK